MIFERLTLHQFQRFRDTSTIEFPEPNAGKSIVLVLAPNNSGKTTVLRALRFLLYGYLAGHDRDGAWNLANDLVRSKARPGENIDVWVEARMVIGDSPPITIRRQLRVRRNGPDRWIVEGPYLLHKKTEQAAEPFQPDADGSLQSRIETDVPEDLFSWFYFEGEPADRKMSKGNSRALVEPLKKAIQLRRWSRAISLAESVASNLKTKLQRESRNHGAYTALIHRKDVVMRGKAENENELAKAARELRDLQTQYAQIDASCQEVSAKAAESQGLYRRLKDQEQKRDRATADLAHARAEIRSLVAQSGGLPLLGFAIPTVELRLKELRDANLLPADISKGFIERLMSSSKCVCGRCIDEAAIAELQAYMARTLASATSNDLTNLANALEGGKDSPLRKRIESYPGQLAAAVSRKTDAARELADAVAAVADLKPQVQSSSIEEFNRLIRERDRVAGEVRKKEDLMRDLSTKIQGQVAALKVLNADLAKARPKKGAGQIPKLEAALDVAERLAGNLREGRQRFQDAVYDLLQERLSHHFDKTVTGGNRAKLDRETLLPHMVDPFGNVVRNAGGGEAQVLAIAFVAGLAELRTRINRDLKAAGLGGRLLGEQGFVVDSPFTSADHNYMRAIAEFLPGKAPQLLVMIAKQNWPDTVREALEPHVARAYGITLHTPARAHDPESFNFRLDGKTVCLREELAMGELSYTTFSEIL